MLIWNESIGHSLCAIYPFKKGKWLETITPWLPLNFWHVFDPTDVQLINLPNWSSHTYAAGWSHDIMSHCLAFVDGLSTTATHCSIFMLGWMRPFSNKLNPLGSYSSPEPIQWNIGSETSKVVSMIWTMFGYFSLKSILLGSHKWHTFHWSL